ncbi:isochorismatase family protein [Lysobacter enzymogenes]|uniref:isochorismatase family protein n=1 Tax=Lysobacter enzymogenes TaxID=69 RepID=UPI001AF1099B|nr:isochorismatase family protein [Lysobacter enzymogenes]QQQ03658.1 isochorismatase family protein [Lysobacter enzymogenes]
MTIPKIATYPMPGPQQWPSNRVDWRPEPARAVLLIHDLQEYFLAFYDQSQAPVPQLLENVRALRDACDDAGVPVVYTAQPPVQSAQQRGLLQPWWGPGITAQPQLAPVAAPIAPRPHDTVLTKWRYSAFVSSDLRQRMREQGRDQLIVCGIYAHIGCMMTVADAFMHDIQPFLVADAVADFSAQEHQMALDYVSRRCGVVLGRADCAQALADAAGLPASLTALRTELALIMERPLAEIGADDNPFEAGLDSIRMMTLLERWSARGERIGLVELAERGSVAQWWELIQQRRAA